MVSMNGRSERQELELGMRATNESSKAHTGILERRL